MSLIYWENVLVDPAVPFEESFRYPLAREGVFDQVVVTA